MRGFGIDGVFIGSLWGFYTSMSFTLIDHRGKVLHLVRYALGRTCSIICELLLKISLFVYFQALKNG